MDRRKDGLLTVQMDGRVVMKIITGWGGFQIDKAAEVIRNGWPMSVKQAYEASLSVGFGSLETLVVMAPEESWYYDEPYRIGDLASSYGDTFNDPGFNPRRKDGEAEYFETICLGDSPTT